MSNQNKDASVPGQFPSQDGVDRSDHVAVIFNLNLEWSPEDFESIDWQSVNELDPPYDQWVHDAIQKWEAAGRRTAGEPELDRQPYQVGPAAGGLFDTVEHIITLYRVASQLYGHIDFGLFILFVVREARRKAKEWASRQTIERLEVGQVYTPFVLKYMCIGYVMDEVGHATIGDAHIICLTTEFYDGISSPAHPTSMVEYQVSIPTKAGIYGFHIRGDSAVVEMFLNTGDDTKMLSSPPRLDEIWGPENDPNITQ